MDNEMKKLYKEFCKEAKYYREFPDKPYMVHANGKLLSSDNTTDLFKQYVNEINSDEERRLIEFLRG